MVTSYMENWLLLVRHAQIDKKDNLRIFADSMNDLNDWKIDVNINSLMLSLELIWVMKAASEVFFSAMLTTFILACRTKQSTLLFKY